MNRVHFTVLLAVIMRSVLKTLPVLLLTIFWQSGLMAQTDYSKTAAEPIKLLLNIIEDGFSDSIDVEIVNRHNGIYQMNSSIEKTENGFKILTQINDMTNTNSNTSVTFSKDELIKKLNKELDNSDNQLVIAGNYQVIRVRYGKKSSEFHTRRAFGLMTLLKDGK
ncbi:MAG: hypothetical protein ABJ387_14180 [Balneola sp.]